MPPRGEDCVGSLVTKPFELRYGSEQCERLASTDVVYEELQSGRLEEEVTTAPSSRVTKPRDEEETVAENNMDLLGWLRKQLAEAEPDLLREMVRSFAEALMGAEADALCGAAFRERSGERVNRRNGYRERPFDTRAGTIALAVPKLRSGSYFPDWLLERRRRAERALVAVVAECYVRGVSHAPRRRPREDARHRGHLEEPGLARWPRASTRRWPPSAPGPWTRAPTPTCGSTPWRSGCASRGASCAAPASWPAP